MSTTLVARRRVLAAILAGSAATTLALSGCSLSSPSGSTGSAPTLTVATWKGYGADLPWVAEQFKADTGANLKFVYIDSEQNQLKLLGESKGQIDVALPNLQYISQGAAEGVFSALDPTKLTNFENIYPQFAEIDAIRQDGKVYGVPWVWGSTALFYNQKALSAPPTSISVLWDPAYKGKIALYDDPTVLIPLTALHLGLDPQNPEMSKILPALQQLKDNAKVIYSNSDDLAKAIANGSVALGVGASSSVGGMIGAGQTDLKYVIPSEGGVGWADNWSIAADTKNAELAYKWVNYMTSPQFLSKWAESESSNSPAPTNQEVVRQLSADAQERIQANPDRISDLTMQLPLPVDRLQSWISAWQQVTAG
ncbi:PotD/PotF family extracellular solute-binding protein [Paenarthrobacter sp. NPDC058040]|uniref:ABC transporter substrate-binding protein n=1 Tax=unclassified Paenarthrobacter TaxID=2634190 RepID=UPI0036DB3E23